MRNAKRVKKWMPYVLIVGGLIGFFFSFLIMVEKGNLAADPSYIPPCTVSPFISCKNVMLSDQAAVFGFPNPLLGIAGFAIVTTMGFALLAGATFRRWFWVATQLGLLLATVFIYWLFYQAVYNIGSLCPYCMVVWAVTIPLFVYVFVHNLHEKHFHFFRKAKLNDLLIRASSIILALMYLVIIVAILYEFWFYWMTFFQ